jgi:ectoine hydroxylase-related dioxygenase (phytanoyl-CoA dioxygenase family)
LPIDVQPTQGAGVQLSAQQRQRFRRDGVLVLPQLAPPAEVAEIRAILEALLAGEAMRQAGHVLDFAAPDYDPHHQRMPQLLCPSEYATALRATRFRAQAHDLARQLLGAAAIFSFDHAMMKPAHDGAATPWHQDIVFHNPADRHRNLTFWMALQDVDAHSGCLRFIPRSHRRRLEPHRPIGGDPRTHGREAPAISGAGAVSAPLPAGGLTIHDSRTVHGAWPNRSARPRWSYAVIFRLPRGDWLHGWRFGPLLRDPLAGFIPAA